MSARRRQFEYAQSLSPFPEGWFFVTSREDIRRSRSGILQRMWMGVKVVAWCDESGRVCVAEAVCPHMGSDLGPDAGGSICEGRLVCPFHGYEFDTDGQCASTPSADPPDAARLRVFPTQEMLGLIFAWWGIGGREPQWSLPAEPPDQTGWSSLLPRTFRFPGHPQETTENSVDLAHLRFVHGYDDVDRFEPLLIDGHRLTSRFAFSNRRKVGGVVPLTFEVSATALIYGLGYSFVEIQEKSIGMTTRMWILATPVDGRLIDLSLVSQAGEIRDPKRLFAGLGILPTVLRAPVMNWFIASRQDQDVQDDIVIWSRKRYVPRPRLCRSDGEIMPFRAYCAQFYPQAVD